MKRSSFNILNEMKAKTMKLLGIALLWVGLAALVYVPSSDGGTLSSVIAAFGFLSFASGIGFFADGLKREIVESVRQLSSGN